MPHRDNTWPPPSTLYRRFAQATGLIFNDDGTWTALRLRSSRGDETIAKLRAARRGSATDRFPHN